MKVWLTWDEHYPVYSLEQDRDFGSRQEVELSKEEWADYQRVCKEYDDWQAKISGMRKR
jgi:hypothetical protein